MFPIMSSVKPLIELNRVTTRLRDRKILSETSWILEDGESWAIIGPNGSGKTSFTRVISGELPVIHGTLKIRDGFDPSRDITVVSFETQKRIYASESRKEESRLYSGRTLSFTGVREYLESPSEGDTAQRPYSIEHMAAMTAITHLLDRNITRLSTGEFRKVLIAKALLGDPRLLILDEPMEGLDEPSRLQLAVFVDRLIALGVQILFVSHRITSLPSSIDNILCLKDNRLAGCGKRNDLLRPSTLQNLYGTAENDSFEPLKHLVTRNPGGERTDIVVMRDVTVRYGGITVLNGMNWLVKQGEKWLVKGPNGSGKSTLLSLISGDNPQAYSNEIHLFGTRRGGGESIWDIKKRIGLVSSEFQMRYQKDLTVIDAVLSGFFDSVGLFRHPSPEQQKTAHLWLSATGLREKAETFFTHLSFGEQKLALIARAMVKSPELLILDEPCQGLDPVNRRRILRLMEVLGQSPGTSMIYVTHHSDEIPRCFDHVLHL